MVTNIKKLIILCEQELCSREYTFNRHRLISQTWERLKQWMTERDYENFNEGIGYQYCDETFGSRDLSGIKKYDQLRLRAIRMLISYQKDGDFEYRTPLVLHTFEGESGDHIKLYLEYLREKINLKESTIANKQHYLLIFNRYLEENKIELNNLTFDDINDFYSCQNFSLALKHNCNSTLRLFLQYIYDIGSTVKDCSIYILPDNYKKHCKIPTTYTEDEIRRILNAVERGSGTGKRDYLILLLASEYGWRSSDIVNFSFEQIDWDKNMISFSQQKTKVPVVYPLLASIGNAIIDYLKKGRPDTDANEIIAG